MRGNRDCCGCRQESLAAATTRALAFARDEASAQDTTTRSEWTRSRRVGRRSARLLFLDRSSSQALPFARQAHVRNGWSKSAPERLRASARRFEPHDFLSEKWARLVSNQRPLACEARGPAGANLALSRGSVADPGVCRGRGCPWMCADGCGYGHWMPFSAQIPGLDCGVRPGRYWAGDVAGERGSRRPSL
jgi:hypothetical protein